jgi:hypothetical protein
VITTPGSYLGGWIHVNADDVQLGFRRSQTTTERNEGSESVSVVLASFRLICNARSCLREDRESASRPKYSKCCWHSSTGPAKL